MTDADTQLELNLRVGGESLQLAKAKELLLEAQELLQQQKDKIEKLNLQVDQIAIDRDAAFSENDGLREKCEAYDKQVNSMIREAETNLRLRAEDRIAFDKDKAAYIFDIQRSDGARRELEGKLNLIPMWVRRIFGAD